MLGNFRIFNQGANHCRPGVHLQMIACICSLKAGCNRLSKCRAGHGFLAQTRHVLNLSHTHPRPLGRGRIDKGGVSADCNRESIGYENSIFMQSLEHFSQRRTLASNLADIVHIRFAKPA